MGGGGLAGPGSWRETLEMPITGMNSCQQFVVAGFWLLRVSSRIVARAVAAEVTRRKCFSCQNPPPYLGGYHSLNSPSFCDAALAVQPALCPSSRTAIPGSARNEGMLAAVLCSSRISGFGFTRLKAGTIERFDQFVQDAIDGHFDAPPFRDERRAVGMLLEFLESLLESAGKGLDRAQLAVQIELAQVVHLGIGLINAHVTAGVRHVGVLERQQKVVGQDATARGQLSEKR